MAGHVWANGSILDHYRRLAVAAFPELEACPHEFFASMSLYARAIPWKFFNREVTTGALRVLHEILATDDRKLLAFFNERHGEIEVAVRALEAINHAPYHDRAWWENESQQVRQLQQIRDIREVIHPAYLQLCEAVLKTLLHPIAVFERLKRGKSIDEFTPDDRVEEARRAGLGSLESFDSRMRNAIAHGSVAFSVDGIDYHDVGAKGTRTRHLLPWETLQVFEDLLDVCNGLAAAYRLMILVDTKLLFSEATRIPPALLFPEVQHQLNTASWHVQDYLEFEYLDSKRDLNLFVDTTYLDDRKTQLAVIRAAAVATRFMPTFDRCYVQLQRRGRIGGWGLFETAKVRELLRQGVTEAAPYLAAAPDMAFVVFPFSRYFHVGHPLRLIGSIVEVFRTSWRAVRSRKPRPQVRYARMISKKTYSLVTAATVLHIDDLKNAMEFVARNLRSILRDATREARRVKTTARWLRWLPVGYVEVNVHRSDRRRRQLISSGLNANLLCRIVRKTRGQIQVLPLHESVPQRIGNVIIFWNRAAVEPLLSKSE